MLVGLLVEDPAQTIGWKPWQQRDILRGSWVEEYRVSVIQVPSIPPVLDTFFDIDWIVWYELGSG